MHHMDIVHHHQQHDEDVLRKGVIYSLKYLGFVEVLCSMRAIGYNERYTLTRSCIANVAKASKTNVHVDTAAFKELVIKGMVSIDAHAMRGGLDVLMTVSVNFIKLIQRTTRDVSSNVEESHIYDFLKLLVLHPVEQVSFVSVGDPPNSACVGYIAKDKTKRRYCYVFESFSGTASLVMASFRQAFTLKYKDSLMNPQNANDVNATTTVKSISQRSSNASQGKITEEYVAAGTGFYSLSLKPRQTLFKGWNGLMIQVRFMKPSAKWYTIPIPSKSHFMPIPIKGFILQ
ncbi:hypothetical protein ACOME3_009310 [Neoechinorhynchus agilis]